MEENKNYLNDYWKCHIGAHFRNINPISFIICEYPSPSKPEPEIKHEILKKIILHIIVLCLMIAILIIGAILLSGTCFIALWWLISLFSGLIYPDIIPDIIDDLIWKYSKKYINNKRVKKD